MAHDDEEESVRIEGVRCLHETPKAILVRIAGEKHWIPQSQITDDSEVWGKDDVGTLVITGWLARQKHLA